MPVLVALSLNFVDWRVVWLAAGAVTLLSLPILISLLARERTPQALAKEATSTGMGNRHWTRAEVLRSPVFWLLLPMLLGPPAWGTALFFQQVHIAEVKGWPLVDYLALIPVLTFVGVAMTVISGQLIDRFGTALLARAYLFPFALTFLIVGLAETLPAAAVGLAVFGLGSGIQATLPAAFWSEYFGTAHIGAIKAVSTSIMVFGSAIGPGISGALIDLGYDFPDQMLAISAYFIVAAGLVWIAVAKADTALTPAKVDIKRT